MRAIPLTKGKFAIVDDEDFPYLNAYKWQAVLKGSVRWYARRGHGDRDHIRSVYMHRQIMNTPKGTQIDHIDGNGLNNTKTNLRFTTDSQNLMNSRKPRKGWRTSSQYKGVYWHKYRWRAVIKKEGRIIVIGHFDSELEAAKAYDAKAKELFGQYARLNLEGQNE